MLDIYRPILLSGYASELQLSQKAKIIIGKRTSAWVGGMGVTRSSAATENAQWAFSQSEDCMSMARMPRDPGGQEVLESMPRNPGGQEAQFPNTFQMRYNTTLRKK